MIRNIEINEEVLIPFEGFGFYYRSGDGPIFVELVDESGVDQYDVLSPGQGLHGSERFKAVRVVNQHSTAQQVDINIGQRRFIDNRNVGQVSITGPVTIDNPEDMHPGNVSLSLAGKEFSGSVSTSGAGSKYAAVQLLNPVASGKRVDVKRVFADCPAAAGMAIYLRRYSTALTTVSVAGENKITTGPAAVAELRREDVVSLLGSGSVAFNWVHTYETSDELLSQGQSPIVLLEGEGVMLIVSSISKAVYGSFDWSEEAI